MAIAGTGIAAALEFEHELPAIVEAHVGADSVDPAIAVIATENAFVDRTRPH